MNNKADKRLNLDQYEILRELGRGGTSVVYLVKDRENACLYAMKARHAEDSGRLREEAAVLKLLTGNDREGSAIPACYGEVYEESGCFAGFLMEYVEGRTLQKILESGKVYSVRETAETGLRLCAVMERMHGQKPPMIYRDLKPANILIRSDGTLAVVDYGAVRQYRDRAASDTDHLGTEGYAAPEQYGGWEQTDVRTDIYGIGAVMHHMLTGRTPLETGLRPLTEIIKGGAADPAWRQMSKVLVRCCMTAPSMRYSSCRELEKALHGILRLCAGSKKRRIMRSKKRTGDSGERKERAWRKCMALACASVFLAVCSGIFAAASAGAEKMEYRRLLEEAEKETDPGKMEERYARAARIRPGEPDAYICLVRRLAEDYVITKEEKEVLDAVLDGEERIAGMRRKSPGTYAQLEMELGKAFFACYEGGIRESGEYFRKAEEAAGLWFDGRRTAQAMEVVLGETWTADRIAAWRVLEQESEGEAMETGNGVFAAAVCKAAASEISLYTDRYERSGTAETAIREVTEHAQAFVRLAESGRVRVPQRLYEELCTAVESAVRGEERHERRTAEAKKENADKTQIGEAE